MDGIMTVCLGRNMLFDLVIQSYSQLETRYDKAFKTIKENCQNHILTELGRSRPSSIGG